MHGKGPFKHDAGFIENIDEQISPSSLWETQKMQYLSHGLAPDAPARFNARVIGNSEVQLSWMDIAANETGYVLEYADDGTIFQELVTLPPNSNSHVVPLDSLAPNSTLRIKAIGEGCHSAFANEVLLDISTGVEENEFHMMVMNLSYGHMRKLTMFQLGSLLKTQILLSLLKMFSDINM